MLGAYLAWSLLAAEVPYLAAKYGLFPKYFEKMNANKVPVNSLLLTNLVVQGFLIVTMFTQYAFRLSLELTSALTLIRHFLVAAYGLKLAVKGETYEKAPEKRSKELLVATIATFYTALMVYSGGLKYVLLSALVFLPTTLIYYFARKNAGAKLFQTTPELGLFAAMVIGAVLALWAIGSGRIVL